MNYCQWLFVLRGDSVQLLSAVLQLKLFKKKGVIYSESGSQPDKVLKVREVPSKGTGEISFQRTRWFKL